RQRDRSRDLRTGALGGVRDFRRRLVQQPVVVRLQFDADLRLFCHGDLCYLIISVITPAPTVLPPSRMAKRCSFSIATGWMSSTAAEILSPGMTISTPAGKVTSPVTSVVRK